MPTKLERRLELLENLLIAGTAGGTAGYLGIKSALEAQPLRPAQWQSLPLAVQPLLASPTTITTGD